MKENKLLPEFSPGRSTVTAILQLTELIIDHIENGSIGTTHFLDVSKAFDSLGHHLIIKKLKNLGIVDK